MLTFPICTPVLRIVQPLGEFFAAVLPAELLLKVTYSDPLQIVADPESGKYELQGHQRKIVQDRLRTIGEFINTVEAAFPNSIILAANYKEDGLLEEEENIRWSVELNGDDGAVGSLVIPSEKKLAALVDGQHRLYGFTEARPERLKTPLLCSIYLDLPNPFQAYLFATINYNQKSVDKSQSYELYGYDLEHEPQDAWSPEKTAVFLCRKLNTDKESALQDHIVVAAQSDNTLETTAKSKKKNWMVSTATVVEGLLRLFSRNPKRDRSLMHSKHIGKGRNRSLLADDKTPLRKYYLEGNDLLIFTLVKNYFNAVSEVLWKQDSRSYIYKTVGIQALFDILRSLCPNMLEKKDISQRFFASILHRAKDIDFVDNFFQASGTGRSRIRNCLELRLDIRTLESIRPDQQEQYKRLCQL